MNEKSLKLLEQYDLELNSARRGRGSYICETSLGKKLLTDYTGSEKKIVFTNQLLERMEQKGLRYTDKVMAGREGAYLCRDWDDNPCVLKDWQEGRECDTSSAFDVEAASAHLAQLHTMMVWPQAEGERLYAGECLTEVWRRHNQELKKVNEFVRKRKQKTEFESLFLKQYPEYARQAREALEMLEDSGYEALRRASVEAGEMCHGNYNQHNIYFLGKKQIFTSNFEKCGYDIPVSDLYQFVRKIMEKQEWSLRMGKRMIEAYERIRPLSEGERKYLFIRLCYPEKFWKLANQYYNCRKACLSGKNGEKLKKLAVQEEKRGVFLRQML